MGNLRRSNIFRGFYKRAFWNSLFILIFLSFIRISKGAVFLDIYSFVMKPLWPGSAQKEWLQQGKNIEQQIKLNLLEEDNLRLRKILSLKQISKKDKISAAVISRKTNGWWQQLQLNKGKDHGLAIGDSVVAPGGLIGIIDSVTPTTSRVKLITSPGSKIGAWVQRIDRHGILFGIGTNRVKLSFLDKDTPVKPGDIVSTSPASTLVPANLPIGVIQFIDNQATTAPFAVVQLTAAPEAIDWVQVLKSE